MMISVTTRPWRYKLPLLRKVHRAAVVMQLELEGDGRIVQNLAGGSLADEQKRPAVGLRDRSRQHQKLVVVADAHIVQMDDRIVRAILHSRVDMIGLEPSVTLPDPKYLIQLRGQNLGPEEMHGRAKSSK